jgi:hypothetical protein
MNNKKKANSEGDTDKEKSPGNSLKLVTHESILETSFNSEEYIKIVHSFENCKIDDPILVLEWNNDWMQLYPLGIYFNTF